jgi:hypothetical protein
MMTPTSTVSTPTVPFRLLAGAAAGTTALMLALGCTPPAAPASTESAGAEPASAAPASAEPAAAAAGSAVVAEAPAAGDAPAVQPGPAAPEGAQPPPEGVRSLSGTLWVEASEGAQFKEIAFTDAFVFFRMQDDSTVTLPVDYTGTHPACLGYPSCLLTIDGTQQAVPFFLGMQDDVIFFVECAAEGNVLADGTRVSIAALKEQLGSAIVHESPIAICWNPGRIPFRQAPR